MSHVTLRTPRAGDEREFLALNRRSSRLHVNRVSPPRSEGQFRAFLRSSRRDDTVGLLVCLREDGRIVGAIGLSQIFRGRFKNAYMGYYLGKPYVGRGYMTEAIAQALDYAFGPLGLHRVEANIQPGNAASIAVVKRLGFTLEGYSRRYLKVGGRWRDHLRFAMIEEDWRTIRRRRK